MDYLSDGEPLQRKLNDLPPLDGSAAQIAALPAPVTKTPIYVPTTSGSATIV